ncbi:MAG: protein-glutamate O-methyltransferase CheR [Desulfobacterales bacterium]
MSGLNKDMDKITTESIEINLLVEALNQKYGYDFSHYAEASFKRRIHHFLSKTGGGRVSELIPRLLYDIDFFKSFILTLSIPVTEMFRDPFVYRMLREKVVPYLKTYPFIKIWHAGCASGEEVYSLAILLKEEGLYDRAIIYATDFNDDTLERAKNGIYPIDRIKEYTVNYQRAGGRKSLSTFYYSKYDSVIMNKELKKNIVFASHNLAADSAFGEMHLILCRNVMIYFDKVLQNRVLRLFHESLAARGFLCLGTKESLKFSAIEHHFESIGDAEKIYQRE